MGEAFFGSLSSKLIFVTGAFLLLSVSTLSYLAISTQKDLVMANTIAEADRLSSTVKLGTHYAMMINSREDITNIIANVGRQPDIAGVRIYNKLGQIKFSNRPEEVDTTTGIEAEACYVCHRVSPPKSSLTLAERTRLLGTENDRRIGILTPIENEAGCSENCHFHPADTRILGAIDMVLSMSDTDREMVLFTQKLTVFTVLIFVITSSLIFFFNRRFVTRPIAALIRTTRLIGRGEAQPGDEVVSQDDEIGQLARAIAKMGREIEEKQRELNRGRKEYQNLFSNVPCLVTVQDRDFNLLRFNREFKERFHPRPGDHCYHAYKGRDEKCPNCPVEVTFRTGQATTSEEVGQDAQGNPVYWLVTTSPVRDEAGEVVAAMEMCLDITARKKLEQELSASEAKYHAIFNTIPTPVFLLRPDDLSIRDVNVSCREVYGFDPAELVSRSFLELFPKAQRERYRHELLEMPFIDRAVQVGKDGRKIFVNILTSSAEYSGRRALLVTVSDITRRLEAEQQLIQAGKMTTLGEMAAGVAHELNQPLTVIKSAGSFFLRKVGKGETVSPELLADLAGEIDSHVDRATRIINHLREFGRKPDMELQPVQADALLRKAFDMFGQQLKLRDIEVEWRLEDDLPPVVADPSRLEQVFINLLLNARDAIDEAAPEEGGPRPARRITLCGQKRGGFVEIRISDTGKGIPPGVRERIFEPFFTTKGVGKGTGLGLSISYGILKDCGGDIVVESTGQAGTTFRLSLPVAQREDGHA